MIVTGRLQWWKGTPFKSVWAGNYERGSMFVCVFNGRYKLWWNITSLFMCVCQHMWVERCASEELFLCNRVGGIFVCVYLYIGEFVSSARECRGGRGGGQVKTWRRTCDSRSSLSATPSMHLSFSLWQHDHALHLLITICLLSPHTWTHSSSVLRTAVSLPWGTCCCEARSKSERRLAQPLVTVCCNGFLNLTTSPRLQSCLKV